MSATPIHPLSYSLPDAWNTAIDGWIAWLTAAGHSAATRRTRRSHVRTVAREVGVTHPRDVTGADLLAILGRPAIPATIAAACAPAWHPFTASASPTASSPTTRLPHCHDQGIPRCAQARHG